MSRMLTVITSGLSRLAAKVAPPFHPGSGPKRTPAPWKPGLESLEAREVPATLSLPNTSVPEFTVSYPAALPDGGTIPVTGVPVAAGNFLGTLDGTKLTASYCVDLNRGITLTTYNHSTVTHDGTIDGAAVPHAGEIAWLLTHFGPTAVTPVQQDALQAAIWRTEYGDGFQLDGVDNDNAAPEINGEIAPIYQGYLDALAGNSEPVGDVVWISPGPEIQPLVAIPGGGNPGGNPQTYGTFLLGATWQQQAMDTAARMDQLATDLQNHALAATDQFFKGVAEWASDTLRFLAQEPGVPARQIGAAIWKYMTNNAYDNNAQLYASAVRAVHEMQQNPARFFGKNAVNILLTAVGTGAAIQRARALAAEVRTAEKVATTLENLRQSEFKRELGPASDYTIKVPTLTAATSPAKLTEAIKLTAAKSLPFRVKTGYLAQLLRQIRDTSGGSWDFTRMPGADGSAVFSGGLGYSVVVRPDGGVFTGGVFGTPSARAWGAALVPELVNGREIWKIDSNLLKPW